MDLLGGQKRETLREVEAHLVAENAFGPHSGAIRLDHPFVHYLLQQVQVLSHLSDFILFYSPSSLTENAKIMASWKVFPAFRVVLGKSSWFGLSGKCWHSMATPL